MYKVGYSGSCYCCSSFMTLSISPGSQTTPPEKRKKRVLALRIVHISKQSKRMFTLPAENGVHGLPLPDVLSLLLVDVLENVVNLVNDLTKGNLNVVNPRSQPEK